MSMTEEIQFRVLSPNEGENIRIFEKKKLEMMAGDSFLLQMESWSSPWRDESLNHYLPFGWSFGAWKAMPGGTEELVGYFLAQPLLYFRNHAQTLWVEHIGFNDDATLNKLTDIAKKYGRDKHLQAVLFAVNPQIQESLERLGGKLIDDKVYEVPTTKVSR